MIQIKDITTAIEEFAPLSLQLDWDNSGPQVGNFDNKATSALLTLDVTEEAVAQAKHLGANLIISHHPLIFSGLRSITGQSATERIVAEAIRSDIAIYSSHTSIDAAEGGVSWAMAQRLRLQDTEPLTPEGLGCVGNLQSPCSLAQLIETVKAEYNLNVVRTNTSPLASTINRIAVMGGSGASETDAAIAAGAQAYITGDAKYHDFQRAQERISLIDIGHFESEIDVLDIFIEVIQKKYPTFALHTQKGSFTQIK